MNAAAETIPEGPARVAAWLAARAHPHAPILLQDGAHTAAAAALALGVEVGQIAKSIVFRRRADDRHVLVVASGDRRVDEAKVAARFGPIGRADASFVKQATGFSIGGVSPFAHRLDALILLDRDLQRFAALWAAAGHPRAVVHLTPAQLAALLDSPYADVAQTP